MMVKTSTHTPTHTRGSSCDARWCANDLALGWRNRKSGCVRRLLRWIDSSSCKKKTHKKIKTCPFRYDSYLPPPSSDPDENTFRRRSRPAIPETFSSEPRGRVLSGEFYHPLCAELFFLFNKWIKVFHSTAKYTPFEEMRPALTKWFLAWERKKHIIASQLKLQDHSHLWTALRSSSHLF